MVSIKAVTSENWQSLKELRLKAVADSPEAFGDSIETVSSKSDEYWKDGIANSNVFVTEENGVWIGMIVFKQDDDGVWAVKSLWVDPNYRNQGIGKLIMQKAINAAKSTGVKLIELGVNVESKPAINLYESLGFVIVRKIDDKKMGDGSIGSLYTMRLSL